MTKICSGNAFWKRLRNVHSYFSFSSLWFMHFTLYKLLWGFHIFLNANNDRRSIIINDHSCKCRITRGSHHSSPFDVQCSFAYYCNNRARSLIAAFTLFESETWSIISPSLSPPLSSSVCAAAASPGLTSPLCLHWEPGKFFFLFRFFCCFLHGQIKLYIQWIS